jgi:methyl-accepting chemotaxis protein
MIFFLAILVSAYMLYSIPYDLLNNAGYGSVLTKTYITIAFTLILGAITIFYVITSKKELIVFKEKTAIDKQDENGSSTAGSAGNISLDDVKTSISNAGADQKDLFKDFLSAVCKTIEAGQGALYESKEEEGKRKVVLSSGYALNLGESALIEYEFGEGLIGQAAAGSRALYVDDIPEGYIKIISGLGSASPRYLYIVPIKNENEVKGIIEIASFNNFSDDEKKFVEAAADLLAKKLTK